MKQNEHPMDVLTDTKNLTDVLMPPNPQHMDCFPIVHADIPYNIDIQGSIQMCGWCWTHGEASKPMGVSKYKEGPLHLHITCIYPLGHTGAQESIEDIQGVFEHMEGIGATEHTGAIQTYGGHMDTPNCKTCLPLRKSSRKPI